jgi:hypothetical protein
VIGRSARIGPRPIAAAAAGLVGLTGCAAAPRDAPALAVAGPPLRAGAVEVDAPVPVSRSPWGFADQTGEILQTPHYRLHTTVQRPWVGQRLPLFMERALSHYCGAIATLPLPAEPLESYLFDSRRDWEAKTRLMLGDQAMEYLRLGRGGYTTEGISVLYYIGRRDTLAIAAHEGWHQFSQRTFRRALPIWLEEGVATYMEGFVVSHDGIPTFRPWANLERYEALRDALRREAMMPVGQLLAARPETLLRRSGDALLAYYAQVWALVHFLVEGEQGRYRTVLQRLVQEAASGRGGRLPADPAAFLRGRLDVDPALFEEQYLDFVRRITTTGGREVIIRGESPLVNR